MPTDYEQTDREAQQHPEGNVPGHIRTPTVGLPVEDGLPDGEQNGEVQEQGGSAPADPTD